MLDVSIDIEGGVQLEQLLARLPAALQQPAMDIAGRAASNLIKDHLIAENKKRKNRLGAKRSNYFANAAESVYHRATAGSVTVHIAQIGMALHYYGGKVEKPGGALTIPARAEAYGRMARDPANPPFRIARWAGGNKAALVERDSKRFTVWYWLVKSVTIKPDKKVLPTETAILDAVLHRLERYIARRVPN
jgi:hypothetical protein